jgi:osmoprotectant transport system ATP-binding protein
MITLDGLTKRYSQSGPPAVDAVSMEVPEGATVALIGPSGCGKTTTLRMINRLIEPTSGRIFVGGEDVTAVDPVLLRRRIGYVIQQVGLFPHMTAEQNIAVVPKLLGWSGAKILARTDELLDLVGLDAAVTRPSFPWQLSGGQRQRVGVARALAADPPVLLMDEPFGAIDPVARLRLQDEFRLILSKVKKTVVLVTHDLDEAIKLGDRLAIMRAGRLVQYDTPDQILSHPADAFVAEFIGADGPLKRLGLLKVDALLSPEGLADGGPRLVLGASLREALALMVASDVETVAVEDGAGRLQGYVHRKAIFAA